MKTKTRLARLYRGVAIFPNTAPGYALRWSARHDGKPLAADTLQGIKRLIREAKERAQ